jgi:hypothetical protein
VFERGVLRGIFGLKRYEVTGEWRKLHNEDLNDQIIMRWTGNVARRGERSGVYMISVMRLE